jgi:hypothetical protein
MRADAEQGYSFEFRNSADEPLCRMALEIR